MGEMADMMLDGTLCEGCGTYIDDDGGDGIPRYCSNRCARDRGALHALPSPTSTIPNPAKTNCPICRKRVKAIGLAAHVRDVHPKGDQPMPNARQFVACKFRVSDTRTFTYHWDGEPLNDGDTVRVPDARSDGWKKVFVVSVTDAEPSFPTKPILGLHVEEEPSELEAAAAPARKPNLDDPFGLPSLD